MARAIPAAMDIVVRFIVEARRLGAQRIFCSK